MSLESFRKNAARVGRVVGNADAYLTYLPLLISLATHDTDAHLAIETVTSVFIQLVNVYVLQPGYFQVAEGLDQATHGEKFERVIKSLKDNKYQLAIRYAGLIPQKARRELLCDGAMGEVKQGKLEMAEKMKNIIPWFSPTGWQYRREIKHAIVQQQELDQAEKSSAA